MLIKQEVHALMLTLPLCHFCHSFFKEHTPQDVVNHCLPGHDPHVHFTCLRNIKSSWYALAGACMGLSKFGYVITRDPSPAHFSTG